MQVSKLSTIFKFDERPLIRFYTNRGCRYGIVVSSNTYCRLYIDYSVDVFPPRIILGEISSPNLVLRILFISRRITS